MNALLTVINLNPLARIYLVSPLAPNWSQWPASFKKILVPFQITSNQICSDHLDQFFMGFSKMITKIITFYDMNHKNEIEECSFSRKITFLTIILFVEKIQKCFSYTKFSVDFCGQFGVYINVIRLICRLL